MRPSELSSWRLQAWSNRLQTVPLKNTVAAAEAVCAFRHINLELRHQYVLTYYADELPSDRRGAVQVLIPGRRDLEVRAVIAMDQVQRSDVP